MSNETIVLPIRHFAFLIEGTEYESGWGCRPDGVVAFLNEERATHWIEAYDKKWNNEKQVPYEYTKYTKVGFREISEANMERVLKNGLVHANKLRDLQ